MRTLTGDQLGVLGQPDFQIYSRLLIEGIPLKDLLGADTEPLRSASKVIDLDNPVETGEFTCHLFRGVQSLSPYLSGGAQLGGTPIFAVDRSIVWQVQCVRQGTAVSYAFDAWRAVFRGAVDSADVDPQAGTVTVHCRDRLSALQLTEIENISTNADGVPNWGLPITGGLLQTMIQQLLDDVFLYAYGAAYPDPFEVVGSPPTDTATSYWQERTNLMDAIRTLGVGKNGWDLRGRWDGVNGLDTFVLTYYLPDRPGAGTPTHLRLGSDGVNLHYLHLTNLSYDLVGIRNVAEVTPADEFRVPVISLEPDSILRYGRRFLAVSEDTASHIDTPDEAATLGSIILGDLGTGKTAIGLELPFCWVFEVNDLFTVGTDGYCFDREDLVFAATHIELKYEGGKGSTVLQGRQAGAAAAATEWRKASSQYVPKRIYVTQALPPVGPAQKGALWIPVPVLP